jgi:hypothetical protein
VPDDVRDRVVTRIRSITLTLRTESAESALSGEAADS